MLENRRKKAMLDRPTAPLEIARKVLKPETIRRVKLDGFPSSTYSILDRWALNSPDELKRLEQRGEMDFLLRLDEQQIIEHRALCSDEAWEMEHRGMSKWEILRILGIDTELRITK
jgi:hypothetical protein